MEQTDKAISTKRFRLSALDFYRGFCMFGVIFGHALTWYGLDPYKGAPTHDIGISPAALGLGQKIAAVLRGLPTAAPGFILLIGMMAGFHYLPGLRDGESVRKTLRRLAWRVGELFLIVYAFSLSFYLVFRTPSGGVDSSTPDTARSARALLEILIFQRLNHRMAILVLIGVFLAVSIAVVLLRGLFSRWFTAFGIGVLIYIIYLLFCPALSAPASMQGCAIVRFLLDQYPLMAWALFYFAGLSAGILLHRAIQAGRLPFYAAVSTAVGGAGLVVWAIMAVALASRAGAFVRPIDFEAPLMPYYMLFALSFAFLFLGLFMIAEKSLDNMRGFQWLKLLGRHSLFAFVFQWCAVTFCFYALNRVNAPHLLRWAAIPLTLAVTAIATYCETLLLGRWKAFRRSAA